MSKDFHTNSVQAAGGLSLPAILGVVFVVLKLTGTITWSWWLVLLPFYGPALLAAGFILVALTIALVAGKLH